MIRGQPKYLFIILRLLILTNKNNLQQNNGWYEF